MGGSIIGNAPTGPSDCRRGGPGGDPRDTDLGPPILFKENVMKNFYSKPGASHARYYQLLKETFPNHPKVRVAISIGEEGVEYTCWAYPPKESGRLALMGCGPTFIKAWQAVKRYAKEHPENLEF